MSVEDRYILDQIRTAKNFYGLVEQLELVFRGLPPSTKVMIGFGEISESSEDGYLTEFPSLIIAAENGGEYLTLQSWRRREGDRGAGRTQRVEQYTQDGFEEFKRRIGLKSGMQLTLAGALSLIQNS